MLNRVSLHLGQRLEFFEESDIQQCKLVIHCGGCMISNQRMAARLRDLKMTGIPITNYMRTVESYGRDGPMLCQMLQYII